MRTLTLAAILVFGASGCGHDAEHDAGGHGAGQAPPSSTPIPTVTTDAVYVVNGEDSSISVLDASTGATLGTIGLGNVRYPHHIYLSADKKQLAVAVPGHDLSGGHSTGGSGGAGHGTEHGTATVGGAVLVLDAATGALVKARRLDAPNH